MSSGFLVDTDVLVDFLRGEDQAVAFVKQNAERIVVSAIVLADLYAGGRGEEELAELDSLVQLFPTQPVTPEIAREGGLLKQEYGKTHGVGLADALLAATAQHGGLILKTLNVKHYPMFPDQKAAYTK